MIEEQTEEFLEEDTQKDMYMTFKTGEEYFCISISNVYEIIGLQPITQVPEVEDYIKGLINLRGKIIPVIDVRVRFHQEALEYNDRTCIIVVDVKNTIVGLIVEKIHEVIKIDKNNIVAAPSLSINMKGSNKYICGLAKAQDGVKLLLDLERLIRDEDLAAVSEIENIELEDNEVEETEVESDEAEGIGKESAQEQGDEG